MVFALVGDSTMTSDFGNVTLFPVIQVEATTELLVGTNLCGPEVLGIWYLAVRCKRFFLYLGFDAGQQSR